MAPEVFKAGAGKSTPCHRLRRSPRAESPDATSFPAAGSLPVEYKCEALRTRKGELIGYHYTFTVSGLEGDASPDDSGFKQMSVRAAVAESRYEFAYDPDFNSFYQRDKDDKAPLRDPNTPLSGRFKGRENSPEGFDGPANATPGSKAAAARSTVCTTSQFYKQIYPLILRVCKAAGDNAFLDLVNAKTAYSQNVNTYRLAPGGKIRSVNDANTAEATTSLLCSDEDAEGKGTGKNNSEKDSIQLMRAALRSKEYVERVLSMVSVPTGFFWISLICLLSTGVAITMAVVQFATYMGVLDTLRNELEIVYYVPNEYTAIIQSAVYGVQAIAVQE